MKDFAKSIRTGNAVPGTWKPINVMDGPAQEKEYNNYSLIVQHDSDEELGDWWSWYVYRGNTELAKGETKSESQAKSKAESWLEHSIPMKTGNSKVENEYKPGTYDPNRHEINLMKIDYEISKWRKVISGEKQRIASLERMVSSGDYGKMTAQELKEAKRGLEAAYMRLDQALSMKKRATGNAKVGNEFVAVKKKDGTYMPVEEGFYYKIDGKRVGVEKIEGKTLKLTDGTTIRVDSIKDIDVGNSRVGNGYIGMYAKTATERKFDNLLSEIEEGADIVAEFTFMSANASSARSQLDKIIQSANQAKQILSKLEQEPNSIFNKN